MASRCLLETQVYKTEKACIKTRIAPWVLAVLCLQLLRLITALKQQLKNKDEGRSAVLTWLLPKVIAMQR